MLLEELDKINAAIIKNYNHIYNEQFYYGSGTTEDMEVFLINENYPVPLLWWVTDDGVTLKSGEFAPFSDLQINTIDATYLLLLSDDIDLSLEERNKDAYTLDNIITRFQNDFNNVKPSKGTVNVNGTTQSRAIRRSVEGLQGKFFSINFTAPENLDYCEECD